MIVSDFNSFGKNILITGGNSGIGFYCLINLLLKRNNLFVPLKSKSRKEKLLNQLSKYFECKYLDNHLNIIEDIDFSDLFNVKKIKEYLSVKKIKLDIVILNAGMQYTGSAYPKVSKQGVELTFAVNHLAHFYLISIINSFINESKESRILIPSSDVHDPKSSGGNVGAKAGLKGLRNFKEEINAPFTNFNADRSYKNSKLCNILFAKKLAKRLKDSNKNISVITWAPGLVFPEDGLGFFRYSSKFNKIGYSIFSNLANNVLGISEDVKDAGRILFEIAFYKKYNHIDYVHLSNKLIAYKKHRLSEANVSEEALDSKLADQLWNLSEDLCISSGISFLNI